MNIKSIFTLAVMAGVFFTGAGAAEGKDKAAQTAGAAVRGMVTPLKTATDSLSYAAGVVRTDGLIPYLKQSLGVDTAYMPTSSAATATPWRKVLTRATRPITPESKSP